MPVPCREAKCNFGSQRFVSHCEAELCGQTKCIRKKLVVFECQSSKCLQCWTKINKWPSRCDTYSNLQV